MFNLLFVRMRQPILFPPLEDIEFWETKANLVTQFDGEVFVWNPDTKHIHVFYHRDLAPSESFNCQVRFSQKQRIIKSDLNLHDV